MPIVEEFEVDANSGFLVDISNSNTCTPIDASSPSTSFTSSTQSSCYREAIVESHREVAFCGIENAFKPILLPDFDLKTLLEVSPLGLLIMKYYEQNKSLDNSKRTLLVDIVCKKIYNYVVKHRLTHSDYNVLVAKIVTLFPMETVGTYYVPAISKKNSITNKPQVAKGRLVDKIRNLLRLSRAIQKEKTVTHTHITEMNITEDIREYKSWLDTRIEPWSEVIEKWKYTFNMRRTGLANNVDDFFSQLSILRDPRAVFLVRRHLIFNYFYIIFTFHRITKC